MCSLENVNHAGEFSCLRVNLNWLSNYSCVTDLITTACGKHFNMKISESEKNKRFENVNVRVRSCKNGFFNTGINVKIICKLTRKGE